MTTPSERAGLLPAEMAVEPGYWTLTIKQLDRVLDQLSAVTQRLGESKHHAEAAQARDGALQVRMLRDGLLARQYDANRRESRA